MLFNPTPLPRPLSPKKTVEMEEPSETSSQTQTQQTTSHVYVPTAMGSMSRLVDQSIWSINFPFWYSTLRKVSRLYQLSYRPAVFCFVLPMDDSFVWYMLYEEWILINGENVTVLKKKWWNILSLWKRCLFDGGSAHQLPRNDWFFQGWDGREYFDMSITCPQRKKTQMVLNQNVSFRCNRCALSITATAEVKNESFSQRRNYDQLFHCFSNQSHLHNFKLSSCITLSLYLSSLTSYNIHKDGVFMYHITNKTVIHWEDSTKDHKSIRWWL